MRIGVVCEGPTDAHAIVCFLHASLNLVDTLVSIN